MAIITIIYIVTTKVIATTTVQCTKVCLQIPLKKAKQNKTNEKEEEEPLTIGVATAVIASCEQ